MNSPITIPPEILPLPTDAQRQPRLLAIVFAILISFVVFCGLLSLSFVFAFAGKPLGCVSADDLLDGGRFVDGEMWYVLQTREPQSMLGYWKTKSSRLKRMNLETGKDSETGISVNGEAGWTIKVGNRLCVVTEKSLYQVVDNRLDRIGPKISLSDPLHVYPFEMDGKVTTVRRRADGSLSLTHLIDGNWNDGRPIVLPGPRRVWQDAPDGSSKSLLPLTSEQPSLKPTRGLSILEVLPIGRQYFLMFSDIQLFAGLREGFEYADGTEEVASALAPMNATREVSGWRPIFDGNPEQRWLGAAADNVGIVFTELGRSGRIVRRRFDGHWEVLEQLYHKHQLESPFIVVDPKNPMTYVVYWNDLLEAYKVSRVIGNQVQSPHIIVNERMYDYLRSWERFICGIILAWLVQLAILAGAFTWLTRRECPKSYAFGHASVRLASFGQRALAGLFDLAIILGSIATISYWSGHWPPISNNWTDELLARMLIDCETMIQQRFDRLKAGDWKTAFRTLAPDPEIASAFEQSLRCARPILIMLLGFVSLRFFAEVLWETSPGKRLVGIRTVRTTLRPSGLRRTLAREILSVIDVVFGLTPTPAILSMLLSEKWQRLGDRVADTIVICVRSRAE